MLKRVWLEIIESQCSHLKNSIIILSSNLSGEEQEKKYYNDKELNLATIFDNVYEAKTFTEIKGAVNLDYTFDEYIENVRKADYTILRTSRTQHYLRDIMLYWLINSNKIKNTLLEQNKFYDNSVFFDKLGDIRKLFYDNNYESKELFDLDENLVKSIKNELPFVASDYEKTNPVPSNRIYSNEVIPHDIYNKTIFSWVSTSLPDQSDKIFINQSLKNIF